MYKRILIKISGEVLQSSDAPVCVGSAEAIARDIKTLCDMGIEIGIVIGGGNIIRGRNAGSCDRCRMDSMGMLSTCINSLALQEALSQQGVSAEVFSAIEMPRVCKTFTAPSAQACLKDGKVAIFACGTGLPFFSTDTAAALRAAEIGADALLLAKSVDAVYDKDPRQYPDAKRYEYLTYDKVIADDLHATDLTAITFCKEHGLPIVLFALDKLIDAVNGNNTGTIIK